jgi:hypothetical protein
VNSMLVPSTTVARARRPARRGSPRWVIGLACAATAFGLLLSACQQTPPDRRADVEGLTQQISVMPGVRAARREVPDSPAQGLVNFTISLDLQQDVTGAQFAAITSRYLRGLQTSDYTGYRTEFDARVGSSVFAIDGGRLPITNSAQIVTQAGDWVALRAAFPAARVTLRATITHPGGEQPCWKPAMATSARWNFPRPSTTPRSVRAPSPWRRSFRNSPP